MKKEVCGTAGSTNCLAVRTVIPSIIRFLTNKSKEQASFWRKDTKTRSKTAMFTFPVIPVPIKEEWNHVASLRPNILELCTVFARPDIKSAWASHIHDMLEAAEEEGVADSPAHVQIRALFNKKHNAQAPPRTNISYIIMPSMSLLNRIDPDRQMTAAECLEAIHDDVARFDEMLQNPALFDANAPDMDAEAYIELHESCYLLEPLEERWGKWVTWKCMCEGFFRNGICGHSTLMALLYDATLEFPGEWSTQQLPGSANKKKKPSAWAEFYEEEDTPSRTERWAPRLLGEEDMVVSRSLKVHSANCVGLQCLISAALTGTRR